jgi:hypothetical protein
VGRKIAINESTKDIIAGLHANGNTKRHREFHACRDTREGPAAIAAMLN